MPARFTSDLTVTDLEKSYPINIGPAHPGDIAVFPDLSAGICRLRGYPVDGGYSKLLKSLVGRAFRGGIADRIQHVSDLGAPCSGVASSGKSWRA
ncbi:hypothetical protein [Bradyrhizobium ottawaense]|uniref:hypothetical protein n=1 Tax=Bradyrhizobium ottawaense TaxID=931866 RepID=UPI0014556CFA